MAASTRPESGAGTGFFTSSLQEADAAVYAAVSGEIERLQTTIELIASENIVSRAVLEAQGSVLTNKYAEGYPGRRYYGGCENVDIGESLAIERALAIFGCGFANVQPHSGAQANQAAFLATLEPGDAFLGLSLAAGGHLTHGAPPNLSGKWFKAIQYGVRRQDGRIDYDEVAALAQAEKPKLILAGGSAYPRIIDFARFPPRSRIRWTRFSWSTWRTSQAWWRRGFIRTPSPTPTSSPPRPTRPCAARAAA